MSAAAVSMEPPIFTADSLTLLVTGSVNACLVPYWLHWLRQCYPELVVNVLVSKMAQEFVTVRALGALASGGVWLDDWAEPGLPASAHIEIEKISECFAVFPATLNTTMKLAQGLSDTPGLMALQLTKSPIALAVSFPGGNEIITRQIESLNARPNVVLADAVQAFSTGTGEWGRGRTGFFMPNVLRAIEQLRGQQNDS
jgi:hypothetical protein